MKVVILAGGKGTRFSEETGVRPKPMIEIGGRPILLHIMKCFEQGGLRDFVIALGYKGEVITNYFLNSELLKSELSIDLKSDRVRYHPEKDPDWHVDLVETGLETQTGGRIKALAPIIGDETFLLSWGDGVSDVDFAALTRFHRAHGKLATMLVVRPPARFGHVTIDGDRITTFEEKPQRKEGWINGGVFILEPEVFHYIADPQTQFEKGPLNALASDGQLMAFRHEGFWQCMDTMHDRRVLEDLWAAGSAPWATWEKEETVHSLRVISDM